MAVTRNTVTGKIVETSPIPGFVVGALFALIAGPWLVVGYMHYANWALGFLP